MKTSILFLALISFSNVYSQDTLYFNTMESGDSTCNCNSEVIIDKSDSTEVLFEFKMGGELYHIICETSDFKNYIAEQNDLVIDKINFIVSKTGPFMTITYESHKEDVWLYNSNNWFKLMKK